MIKNIENASKAAMHIQFWRAEYVKRNFLEKNKDAIDRISENVLFIQQEVFRVLCGYLQHKSVIEADYFKLFQKHCYMGMAGDDGSPLYVDNFNVRDAFNRWDVPESILKQMNSFIDVSLEYGYCIDDLLARWDMSNILQMIKEEVALPDPPVFQANNQYHKALPENVLTLLRANPESNRAKLSLQQELWLQFNKEQQTYYEYGQMVNVCGMTRSTDFIITGQALSNDFDLEIALQEIADHIVWVIFEEKTKHGLLLNEVETRAVVDLYDRMALGEYGPSYSSARAIGLWMWDYMELTGCSQTNAIQDLKGKGLAVDHAESSSRTLMRLYTRTRECIEKGDVLAISHKPKR